MAIITEVQFPIKTSSSFEIKPKIEAIKTIAALDIDAVLKLAELAKNPNAVAKLKNNFSMIKAFIG